MGLGAPLLSMVAGHHLPMDALVKEVGTGKGHPPAASGHAEAWLQFEPSVISLPGWRWWVAPPWCELDNLLVICALSCLKQTHWKHL